MAVYPIPINLELINDSAIDVFILQWHTPLPSNWGKIEPQIALAKAEILRNFQLWLIEHFDRDRLSRPLFILVPELSMPHAHDGIIKELLEQLSRPTVIIAGLEYLRWADYRQCVVGLPDMPEQATWLEGGNDSLVVNAAGIWIRDATGLIRKFIQPKRNPYDQENTYLYSGRNVLIFQSTNQISGSRLNFCVQICSDFSSARLVQELRAASAVPCPSLDMDMTFLLQSNEDQDAIQFKEAVKAYFQVPMNMIKTEMGCLIFVNNANNTTGKTKLWGRSKFHFRFNQQWRSLDTPYPTYWLCNDGPHDHQAVIFRESGPCLYWLIYKPVYLVDRVAGAGQPGPFPNGGALSAVILNNGFGQENGLNCFAPILPTRHWLSGEWGEGKIELKSYLDDNNIDSDVANAFLASYETAIADWLEGIHDRDDLARDALKLYFECWKKDGFPTKKTEPQEWNDETSKAVKRMLRAYALVKLGASALPGGSVVVDLESMRHASANHQLSITLMWGGGDRPVRTMVTSYLGRRDSYGTGELLSSDCLLLLVEPIEVRDKAKLLEAIFEKQTPRVVDGVPPENAPIHLQEQGDVVVAAKSQPLFKLLYDSDLLKEIDVPASTKSLAERLVSVIQNELS